MAYIIYVNKNKYDSRFSNLYIFIKYDYFKWVCFIYSVLYLSIFEFWSNCGINSVKDNKFQLDFYILCFNILFCILTVIQVGIKFYKLLIISIII